MTSSFSPDSLVQMGAGQRLLTSVILLYRRTAPQRVRDSCRFHPTCSQFGLEAIREHGAWKGSMLTWRRLLRCRPPHGGDDPVPPRRTQIRHERAGSDLASDLPP